MDRINASSVNAGSFPINQALRAYANSPRVNRPGGSPFAKSVQPMRPVAAPASTAPTTRIEPARRTDPTDPLAKIAPKKSVLGSSSIDQLVGGKVEPIDLVNDVAKITGPKPMTTSAGTYAMYPQAADRNLAATGVSLGRSLDLRG
jgi:hypothetical protein